MLAVNQDSDTDYESDPGTFEEQTVRLGLAKKETLNNGPSKSGGKNQKKAQKKSATKSKAGTRKHVCNECGHEARCPADLKIHVNSVHLKLKPYKCDQCDFAAGDPSALRGHVKAVHEKIMHQCDFCDYRSAYKPHVTRHIKKQHK